MQGCRLETRPTGGWFQRGARIKLRRALGGVNPDMAVAAGKARDLSAACVDVFRPSRKMKRIEQSMHSHDEILDRVRTTLVELFELKPADITAESRLFEDLEIDSIDVVDLMDEVQRYTGRKVSAEDFRSVRTVGDLVAVMQRLLHT